MTKDMTKGSPIKLILQFALPMLLGMLFQQFYNLVDTMIVGKTLGVDALAGVGATGSINFMIIGFCMGVCSGFSIPAAQQFGARKYSELRKYVYNSFYAGAAFAVLVAVLSVVFCSQILTLMRTDVTLFSYSYDYIVVIFIGIPTVFLYNLVSGIIRSLGDSKTPVIFLVFSAIVNIALDFLFILVFKMGVAGAGWATNIAQLLSGIGCFIYMEMKYPVLKSDEIWEKKEERRPRAKYMVRLCSIGVPMGLQYSITAIGSVILQAAVNMLGPVYVASMTAGSKIFTFTCCPFDALGSTMATYGGQNVGAGRIERLGKGIRGAGIIGCAYSIIAVVVLHFTTDYLALLFVDAGQTEIIRYTHQFLMASALFYIPLVFVNVVRFCIQGMGFSTFAILAGVFEMAARTFAALVLIPPMGYMGACIANPLAWIAADLFLIPAFIYCRDKLKHYGTKKLQQE
ncbi:MAG: MATE family efflux transporter [Eubacteriales bacterium]|nr:MATE family efflux transporter [Eubacteriales bacterium]